MKETIINFFSNLLSVILGIVITFTIQGMIDRASDRKDVRSALELVRAELVSNMEDVSVMKGYLNQERESAQYFIDHLSDLDRCPEDSINFHSSVIFGNASLSTSHDALELLKMSSLFQKSGDKMLSMKIIRAYDSCETITQFVNQRLSFHNARFENSISEQNARQIASGGYIDIRKYLKSNYGNYAIRALAAQVPADNYTDLSEVQEAISAIDTYLGSKRHPVPVPSTN